MNLLGNVSQGHVDVAWDVDVECRYEGFGGVGYGQIASLECPIGLEIVCIERWMSTTNLILCNKSARWWVLRPGVKFPHN